MVGVGQCPRLLVNAAAARCAKDQVKSGGRIHRRPPTTAATRCRTCGGCCRRSRRHNSQGPKLRHDMVRCVGGGGCGTAATGAAAAGGAAYGCAAVPLRTRQPGVQQHILCSEALRRLFAQQRADETFGARAERVGERELTLADFGKEAAVLRTVEGIPAHTKTNIEFFYKNEGWGGGGWGYRFMTDEN
jgi:hypothetical protein